MKIDCISDLHGAYPKLDGGDLLIVAGDLLARDKPSEFIEFKNWLCKQNYKKTIVIAGNHDGLIEKKIMMGQKEDWDSLSCCYLEDSGIEYEGIKIWGSPWTPTFYNWHFMKDRGADIRQMWDLIPQDTEILITHGPAFGLCDTVSMSSKRVHENHVGCEELRKVIDNMPNLRLHVFGHIHEGYGTDTYIKDVPGPDNTLLCVNASIMDANYNPTNKPISIEFDKSKGAFLL